MILAAALLAGAAAPAVAAAPALPAAASAPLAERVTDIASRFCVDILSRALPVPAAGPDEQRVFARYGLTPGVPDAAMQALGRAGVGLIARATLASGDAANGAFVVALGGAAGETCRVIVYRAAAAAGLIQRTGGAMTVPARGWKALPAPPQPPAGVRLSFLRRDAAGRPFLANLIAPRTTGPLALVAHVAAVPPNVTLPQGL